MDSSGGRVDASLLWARTLIMAGVVLTVGSFSHIMAGGLMPRPLVMASFLPAASLAILPLLSRPASTRRVVTLVVSGQAAVHAALSLLAGHRTSTPTVGGQAGVGVLLHGDDAGTPHLHDHAIPEPLAADAPSGPVSAVVAAAVRALSHLVDDMAAQGLPMVAAHLLAAVAVGGWLAAGESALWALLAVGAATLVRDLVTMRAALSWCKRLVADIGRAGRMPVSSYCEGFVPLTAPLLRDLSPRGPPALTV